MIGRLIFVTMSGAVTAVVGTMAFAMTSDLVILAVAAIVTGTLLYAARRVWVLHMTEVSHAKWPE
jgi:hypothetical protein